MAGTTNKASELCEVCRNLAGLSAGARLQFGSLDEIQKRLLCEMCRLVSATAENHRTNRPYECSERVNETIIIVPQQISLPSDQKDEFECMCKTSYKIESTFHRPPRPIGVVHHAHSNSDFPVGDGKCQVLRAKAFQKLVGDGEYERNDASLNIPSIRSWLQSCEDNHRDCNILPNGATLSIPSLMVIDVESLCLVDVKEPRYFALSYVWGSAKVLMTLRSNVTDLRQPGALKTFGGEIPTLIHDAILFMQKLGERYLWVDSLCIVQDDLATKMDLIQKMDLIYAEAACTIIAHGSPDAASAIPGVREDTRRPHRAVAVRKLGDGSKEVLVSSPSHYGMYPTVYDTRGWTFQEQLLSRRRLVFGADEVFFSCRSQTAGDWCEDPLTDLGDSATHLHMISTISAQGKTIAVQPQLNPDLAGIRNTRKTQQAILAVGHLASDPAKPLERMKEILYMYTSAVTKYSSRNLTYQSDIMNAFAGILSSLERSCGFKRGSSSYGLLERYFFYNLHFIAQQGATRREGWPSWAWVGWNSQIFFLERESPEQLDLQLNKAYVIDKSSVKVIHSNAAELDDPGAESETNLIHPKTDDQKSPSPPETQNSIPSHLLDHILSVSMARPILAFWADVAPPGVPRIRPHPIRTANVRIWSTGTNQYGHVHEKYGELYGGTGPTNEEWARCRLVYLSHSPRKCVFHIYHGECKGTCNALAIDPGVPSEENQGRWAERVAMAEVCGNEWFEVATTREFVILV